MIDIHVLTDKLQLAARTTDDLGAEKPKTHSKEMSQDRVLVSQRQFDISNMLIEMSKERFVNLGTAGSSDLR